MKSNQFDLCMIALLLTLGQGVDADVTKTGVFWEAAKGGWDLYVSVTADTLILNADLGDETRDLPPDGLNTGLFSINGEILGDSFVALGDERISFARGLTITPAGTGSHADAAWYAIDGAGPEFDPDTGYRLWLGSFFVDPGATLGGAFGGNDGQTQSRIYVGWLDDAGIGYGVYNIPETPLLCGPIVYVDARAPGGGDGTSWGSALNNLIAALDLAGLCPGITQEIWVAAGTYTPAPAGGDRAVSFGLVDGVALYGGFPPGGGDFEDRDSQLYETILSGDLDGDDGADFANNDENSYHVVRGTDLIDPGTILDGFTVAGGNADGPNEEARAGGGIRLDGGTNAPIIRSCRIEGNSGGTLDQGGSGGFRVEEGSPILIQCDIVSNTALVAGGLNFLTSSPLLVNCRILGNTSNRSAGIGMNFSTPLLVNCLFAGNSATTNVGAIGAFEGVPQLINCTLVANTAPEGPGLWLRGRKAGAVVSNCIIWGNEDKNGFGEDAQIFLLNDVLPGSLVINYSCVEEWSGQYGGVGNIGKDPLFADPDSEDYRISAGSPCIDAANNLAVPEGIDTDLDGNPRFVDDPGTNNTGNGNAPIVDMGAYEFQGVTCIWDLDGDGFVGTGDLIVLLGSWGDPYGTADLIALLGAWGPCPT